MYLLQTFPIFLLILHLHPLVTLCTYFSFSSPSSSPSVPLLRPPPCLPPPCLPPPHPALPPFLLTPSYPFPSLVFLFFNILYLSIYALFHFLLLFSLSVFDFFAFSSSSLSMPFHLFIVHCCLSVYALPFFSLLSLCFALFSHSSLYQSILSCHPLFLISLYRPFHSLTHFLCLFPLFMFCFISSSSFFLCLSSLFHLFYALFFFLLFLCWSIYMHSIIYSSFLSIHALFIILSFSLYLCPSSIPLPHSSIDLPPRP